MIITLVVDLKDYDPHEIKTRMLGDALVTFAAQLFNGENDDLSGESDNRFAKVEWRVTLPIEDVCLCEWPRSGLHIFNKECPVHGRVKIAGAQ